VLELFRFSLCRSHFPCCPPRHGPSGKGFDYRVTRAGLRRGLYQRLLVRLLSNFSTSVLWHRYLWVVDGAVSGSWWRSEHQPVSGSWTRRSGGMPWTGVPR